MRRYVPLVWALLAIALAAGAARLRFDTEILHLLPGGLDAVRGLMLHQRHFADPREVILTIDAPTAEDAESGARAVAEMLRAETNLVSWAEWESPWTERPDEAAEMIAYLWYNSPPATLNSLIARLEPESLAKTLERARERLATSMSPGDLASGYDPYGLLRFPESGASPTPGSGDGAFASQDGTFRLVFVRARTDLADYRSCRAWLGEVRGLVARAQENGRLPATARFGYTGRPAFVAEMSAEMEADMAGCSSGTLAVIAVLFWLVHRRLRPLIWLLVVMLIILAGTMALGGLFLGALNVVSLGFAAILLGLAEDFGILIYQECRSHPGLDVTALRKRTAPGIFWSAVTTAGAFFTLNMSALPGLGQLGTMVALGILLAAAVMIFIFLPVVMRFGRGDGAQPRTWALFDPLGPMPDWVSWTMTGVLPCVAGAILIGGGIGFDRSSHVLESRHSLARDTLRRVESLMGSGGSALMILIPGGDEGEVADRLERAHGILSAAKERNEIGAFALPATLWPNPENQRQNRGALATLVGRRDELVASALGAGFSRDALALTENVIGGWRSMLAQPGPYWLETRFASRLLDKIGNRADGRFMALGTIEPAVRRGASEPATLAWAGELAGTGAIITGWNRLGTEIFNLVVRELPRVVMPIFLLVIASLWLAFRSAREVCLSISVLAFGGLMLGAIMSALDWRWNLMNIMALPLLLGMGVDFSIHMQLALRASNGDRAAVRASTGRALLLAGTTTIAGFLSLAFSANAGMASLGRTCALGIGAVLLTAVYLLPVWWGFVNRRTPKSAADDLCAEAPERR